MRVGGGGHAIGEFPGGTANRRGTQFDHLPTKARIGHPSRRRSLCHIRHGSGIANGQATRQRRGELVIGRMSATVTEYLLSLSFFSSMSDSPIHPPTCRSTYRLPPTLAA